MAGKSVNKVILVGNLGKDPEVKAWASKTLPTVEDHLKQARELARGAVGTSGTKK